MQRAINLGMLRSRLSQNSFIVCIGIAALALAMLACSDSSDESAATPTAPPGMFSTLPTDESPVSGDQPPTIELNTPEPTLTPDPTPTPNPTYTPVPSPTPLPSATPVPTPRSYRHTGAHGVTHAQPDGCADADGHSESHSHARAHARAHGGAHNIPNVGAHRRAHFWSHGYAHANCYNPRQ